MTEVRHFAFCQNGAQTQKLGGYGKQRKCCSASQTLWTENLTVGAFIHRENLDAFVLVDIAQLELRVPEFPPCIVHVRPGHKRKIA